MFKGGKRTPRPPYLGPLGYDKLQEEAQRGGCQNRKKDFFSKIILGHLACFEPVVAHFGPPNLGCQKKDFWCVLSL